MDKYLEEIEIGITLFGRELQLVFDAEYEWEKTIFATWTGGIENLNIFSTRREDWLDPSKRLLNRITRKLQGSSDIAERINDKLNEE